MKRIMLIVVTSFIFPINFLLWSQLIDAQKLVVHKDVAEIIQKNQQKLPQAMTTEQFLVRNQARTNIKQALKNKNMELVGWYFDEYTTILDTLIISQPMAAKEVVDNLTLTYADIPSLTETLKFYKGAVDYYLGFSQDAINILTAYLKANPFSELSSLAFSMLLKTYINAGRDIEAYQLIEATSRTYNDEQNFLAGNVCFVTSNDALAEYYLQSVGNSPYKQDALFMLEMLSVLKEDPAVAVAKFKELQASNPNNPFIILCLARLSNLTGNWSDAQYYYAQYSELMKSYREFKIQYELATTYLNTGNQEKALQVLQQAMNDTTMGEYICPLFYLWSEVKTNQGQADAARVFADNIYLTVQQSNGVLDQKLNLVKRVEQLKEGLGSKPSLDQINVDLIELESISAELDTLNAQLTAHPYGLASSNLNRLKQVEQHSILQFSGLMHDYIVADQLKNMQDTLHANQFNNLSRIYKNQLARIKVIREMAQRLSEQNPFLAIRNEIDNNLDVLDTILNNLYTLKNTKKSSLEIARVDSLIAFTERKKAETSLLLDYYDYDNSGYRTIVKNINASEAETRQLLDKINTTREQFQGIYPKFLAKREKQVIGQDLQDLSILIPEYDNLVAWEQTYLNSVLANLDYTGIHISFVETNFYDRDKASKEQSATFDENQILYAENQARKQKVYNQLQVYIDKYGSAATNPGTLANPDINIYASAYFSLAELGSMLNPDKPEENLANYKKVLEMDPRYYLADAVLYNIGYLSAAIAKQKIENAILTYDVPGSTSYRPAALRYSEDNYREPIEAYQQIADDFQGSVYHSEALFRLGYLYFEIGTDAAKPIDYYDVARGYYNDIINQPNDPYLYKALYQRGWTWLNSSTEDAYKNAITDFTAILIAVEQHDIRDTTEAIGYALASLKNIGYCLIGLDGADTKYEAKGVAYTKENLLPQLPVSDIVSIMDEAAGQKLKLYLPMQAIDFMRARLAISPLDINNPIIADSICALCKMYPAQINRGVSPDSIYISERESIIADYGLDSQWLAVNKDKDISRQIEIIRRSYTDMERHYNNAFVDDPSLDNFNRYLTLANHYQKWENPDNQTSSVWLEETQANIIAQNLKLAQITGNPRYYLDLESRIYSYNDKNPSNNMFLDLEGTAYDCARIVCDSLKINPASLKAKYPTPLPISDDQPDNFYRAAAQRFTDVLLKDQYKSPAHDKMYISIMLRQAEIARDQNLYELSNTYYQKIASFEGYLPTDVKRTALISIADNFESQKNYLEAEKWYHQAEAYALSKEDKDILHQYSLLEIQNAIDAAKATGDEEQVAENYLRIADEYTSSAPDKNLQYKGNAQIAFMNAGEYRKSIALLMDIASVKTNAADAFNFYRLAWTEADSVGLRDTADSLKSDFVRKYPASNEAYQVRLSQIDKLASVPSTSKQAGDLYLELYRDVEAKKIDPGKDKSSDLYLGAITMYDQAKDEADKQSYAEQFINKYPDHKATIKLTEYLADRYLAQGDTVRYAQLAKTIFTKDKTNQSRYSNVAKEKLKTIAATFNNAYEVKDWPLAMAKISEFKNVHSGYIKEGLNLDFAPLYEAFTQAETEYKDVLANQSFVNQYNLQLTGIERGYLNKSPDNLIRVNNYTRWKANLVGGDNRIQALKYACSTEIGKVRKLLETGNQYNLGVNDRLKGLNLICRVADHSADALNNQIDKYTRITVEFAGYKTRYKNSESDLYAGINQQKATHAQAILQYAYPYNLAMYKYYYLPGMRNPYTIAAYDRLVRLNSLPLYQMDTEQINNNWQVSYQENNKPDVIKTYKQQITSVVLDNNNVLYQLSIPANSELVISGNLENTPQLEFAYINLLSPKPLDSRISLNNEFVDYVINPIDTLSVGTDNQTRYALVFGEGKFKPADNNLAIHLSNYDNTPRNVYFSLITVTKPADVIDTPPSEQSE